MKLKSLYMISSNEYPFYITDEELFYTKENIKFISFQQDPERKRLWSEMEKIRKEVEEKSEEKDICLGKRGS